MRTTSGLRQTNQRITPKQRFTIDRQAILKMLNGAKSKLETS